MVEEETIFLNKENKNQELGPITDINHHTLHEDNMLWHGVHASFLGSFMGKCLACGSQAFGKSLAVLLISARIPDCPCPCYCANLIKTGEERKQIAKTN
jgi:hypothetical protein